MGQNGWVSQIKVGEGLENSPPALFNGIAIREQYGTKCLHIFIHLSQINDQNSFENQYL